MQDQNRAATCEAVLRHPPAAVAYVSASAVNEVCPRVREMVAKDFAPGTKFGPVTVQLRRERIP